MAIIAESKFKGRERKQLKFDSFKCVTVQYDLKNHKLLVASIYRPSDEPIGQFLDDFQPYLEDMNTLPGDILLSSDFNIHVENTANTHSIRFRELLDCFGLHQHVTVPTQTSNHTLDLIITRSESMNPTSPPFTRSLLSDHFAVLADFSLQKKPYETRQITLRKLNGTDKASFREDLSNLPCVISPPDEIDHLIKQLDKQLRLALDKHAPQTTKNVKIRPKKNPWFEHDFL